jgi:aminotransferase
LTPCVPQGAYYVLADVSRLPGKSSKQKAMHLLARTGVATVPGEAFFHSSQAERFVRFCFAKSDEQLEEAVYRLRVLA